MSISLREVCDHYVDLDFDKSAQPTPAGSSIYRELYEEFCELLRVEFLLAEVVSCPVLSSRPKPVDDRAAETIERNTDVGSRRCFVEGAGPQRSAGPVSADDDARGRSLRVDEREFAWRGSIRKETFAGA